MSMQTPNGYKDGAWEISGQQVICTLGHAPWVLNPMDIEYLQMQHGADFSLMWLKARAVAQPYQVGRYARNGVTFANALSEFATRNGIPVYNSQLGDGTNDRVQDIHAASAAAAQPIAQTSQQPQGAAWPTQQGYPQQTAYTPQQTGYQPASTRLYHRSTGYQPQQPGYQPQQPGYHHRIPYQPQQPGYQPQDSHRNSRDLVSLG